MADLINKHITSMPLVAIQNFAWIDENNKLRKGDAGGLYEQKIRLF